MNNSTITIYKINTSEVPEGFQWSDAESIRYRFLVGGNTTQANMIPSSEFEQEQLESSDTYFYYVNEGLQGNLKCIISRRYKSSERETPFVYNETGLPTQILAKEYAQPAMLQVFKYDDGSVYFVTVGNFTKSIKTDFIDKDFPKRAAFKYIDAYASQNGITNENRPKFSFIEGYNYFNGVAMKTSSNRKQKDIENLGKGNFNTWEIITKGSISVKGTMRESDFKFINAKTKSIRFADGLLLVLKEDQTISNTLDEFKKYYESTSQISIYKFIDFFKLPSETETEEIFPKLLENPSSSYISIPSINWNEVIDNTGGNITLKLKYANRIIYSCESFSVEELPDKKEEIFRSVIEAGFNNQADLKKLKINVYSSESGEWASRFSLLDSLESFITIESNDYIFVNKTWYRVNDELVQLVLEEFIALETKTGEEIEEFLKPLTVEVDTDQKYLKSEGVYNKLIKQKMGEGSLLLDAANITYKGTTTELCDVFRLDGDEAHFYHVKRGKGSHSLSVLFTQISNANKILKADWNEAWNLQSGKLYQKMGQSRKLDGINIINFWGDSDDFTEISELIESIRENKPLRITHHAVIINETAGVQLNNMAKNAFVNFYHLIKQQIGESDEFDFTIVDRSTDEIKIEVADNKLDISGII